MGTHISILIIIQWVAQEIAIHHGDVSFHQLINQQTQIDNAPG